MYRNPESTQAWLIGSGIASLTAAVHLIKDAKVPASNVHILGAHAATGGGIKTCGNAEDGYVIYAGCLPYFLGGCVEELVSLIPSPTAPGKSILDSMRDFERNDVTQPQKNATTHILKQGDLGPEKVDACHLHVGYQQRMELIKIMLESESALGGRRIQEFFDDNFFKSNFWILWSTSFALQPWHSVVEFRRCLRKHLADIQHLNNVKTIDRTQYTVYESIVLPITTFLKREGVDFRFHAKVTDLRMNADGDPTTVSEIVLQDNEEVQLIKVNEADIVITTLGSTDSGLQLGSNLEAPLLLPQSDESIYDGWSLWRKLSEKSHKFGDPLNFKAQVPQSRLETFTINLHKSQFVELYEKLTNNRPGSGALLSLADSNWSLSISVPHQPICSNQPPDVHVIWGYGLNPEKNGNFVTKSMFQCTGKEIMTELLSHLNFPVESLLQTANTIPLLMPLATSPLLPRVHRDRPEVIPPQTTNLALVGQFAEIPDDTTFSMEYSVRGAQTAVYKLMGLTKKPPKVRRNLLLNVFDLLHVT
ncbi:hypothetical protein V496_01583 [Pseudogymnoascus sp. VKM F-4515 (FW-2607)]|nr:hypothetical protein V496_01583 [Pseudogymnoascus sp. VKM F-4515 (FW-2607)]